MPYSTHTSAPRTLRYRTAQALASWWWIGYLPKAPGTWGSLAALPCAWLILTYLSVTALWCLTVILYVVGTWANHVYMQHTDRHDPKEVVIDEVVGQWLLLAWWLPLYTQAVHPSVSVQQLLTYLPDGVSLWLAYAAGFVAFRVCDIFKPWPVSWADQHVKGATGVMLDDVLAGAYPIALWYGAVAVQQLFL